MSTAFILINCELGSEARLVLKLETFSAIKEIQSTLGAYDIIARIEEKSNRDINRLVEKISKLKDISSITLLNTEK
ncbi:MAG: Lrp/AsnC ligand binding domain-containing protein [Thaumarchaeota archaeon]|nr:Lrp/AsnC ligand binding domain-containing protein [Nitrososphaerota archaeon]